jgi:gas vesicle protein
MQAGKGIAIGFLAGLAVAGGAVLLLRDETSREQESARIAELDAQIQRLDQAVSRLSVLAVEAPSAVAPAIVERGGALPVKTATSRESIKRDEDQSQAIAAADAMVDRGLESGHWSREQANDLTVALADLEVGEQGRIQARISAAINEGRLQIEMR